MPEGEKATRVPQASIGKVTWCGKGMTGKRKVQAEEKTLTSEVLYVGIKAGMTATASMAMPARNSSFPHLVHFQATLAG